jgi:hypothetical protein
MELPVALPGCRCELTPLSCDDAAVIEPGGSDALRSPNLALIDSTNSKEVTSSAWTAHQSVVVKHETPLRARSGFDEKFSVISRSSYT